VKYIDGDIVADDSYFAFERYGEGWSQDDLVWADGAPVSALTINDNVVFVNREPGSMVLTLWGNLPLDDPGTNEALAIEDPAEFAAGLFRGLLEKRGI